MASQQSEVDTPKLLTEVETTKPRYHMKFEGDTDPLVTVSIDDDGDVRITPFPESGDHRPFYMTKREAAFFVKMLNKALKEDVKTTA